ncbi:TPA: hypothetical protein ACGSS8_003091 [Pseudomonas aeruginosa]|nr:hypothetical protein [Pseudomonas aeruginosa]
MHDISQKTQIACLRADIEEIIRERDKAEAEAQALREEVAALRARVVVIPDAKAARVILDDGSPGGLFSSVAAAEEWASIWNSDSRNTARVYPMVRVDELAHLNGLTVSEGLLRRLLDSDGIDGIFDAQQNYAAHQELRALLNEQDGGKP